MAAADSPIALFDGTNLDRWTSAGSAEWRVEDGVIVGGQDGDPRRSGVLVTKETFRDFDLSLEFKIDEHGKYNSGVYFRRGPNGKPRGYQINLGRAEAEEHIGLYTDRWLSKGDERDRHRKPLQWNALRVRATGSRVRVWLNGEEIVDFTDPDPPPDLRRPGVIGFQTYGADGHAGWVLFRNIHVTELSSSQE